MRSSGSVLRSCRHGRAALTSPSPDHWEALRTRVAQQGNYLRNPLPPGPGICDVCRGPVKERYRRCYQCSQHHAAAGGRAADAVVPIAYGIKGEQHYQNLVVYKASTPAHSAQTRLRDLATLFLRDHWSCLTAAAGGRFAYLAITPSTTGRAGLHPLASLLAPRIPLPAVDVVARTAYPPTDRAFHSDRFQVGRTGLAGARVLLLDDTWTTGCRVQSLTYALKVAGASSVIAVVLGRLVKPEYAPSAELLRRIGPTPFEITRCGLPNCRGRS